MERKQCALIDPVLDFDPKAGRTRSDGADRLIERVEELRAEVSWILETHVHADHLSAAPYLKRRLGGRIGIGRHITAVQRVFGELLGAGAAFARDGSQFDRLFHVRDGIGEDTFVSMRTTRDATLGMPTLMLPAVQVNMRAGNLPEPEANGIRYLKIPLDKV
jgi:glyoxylase-like metal-dependent hydrolase (beta-lactamase superfamily II)